MVPDFSERRKNSRYRRRVARKKKRNPAKLKARLEVRKTSSTAQIRGSRVQSDGGIKEAGLPRHAKVP
eukprot:1637908-Prymnesium_polylepis.1